MFGLVLSGAAFALAGSMLVTDDPYLPAARAEFRQVIASQTGYSNYCHTGGSFSLWASQPRKGGPPIFGLSAVLHSLRSPGETRIDLLGGLALEPLTLHVANYDCHNGCHNDSAVAYVLPPETLAAIRAKGSLSTRISVRGEPQCGLQTEIHSDDLLSLEQWAAARR